MKCGIKNHKCKFYIAAGAKDIDLINNNLGIIAFRTNNPYGYGRVIEDKDGFAKKIVEENDANIEEKESKLCNSGALIGKAKYIFKFVSDIENNNEGKEKYLTDIVSLANEEDKKVYIIESDELKCKGINDRVALSMVEKDIQNKLRNEAMKNGVSLLDPETVYFLNKILNDLNLKKIRNNILSESLPARA